MKLKNLVGEDEILKTITEIIIPFVFILGTYVVLNGHISPGGGFSGGTILAASLIMYESAFGIEKTREFFNFNTFIKFSVFSVLFYGAAKGYSFMTGAANIPSGIPIGTPGKIISGGLILPLNIAVGILVAVSMYAIYSLFNEGEV